MMCLYFFYIFKNEIFVNLEFISSETNAEANKKGFDKPINICIKYKVPVKIFRFFISSKYYKVIFSILNCNSAHKYIRNFEQFSLWIVSQLPWINTIFWQSHKIYGMKGKIFSRKCLYEIQFSSIRERRNFTSISYDSRGHFIVGFELIYLQK